MPPSRRSDFLSAALLDELSGIASQAAAAILSIDRSSIAWRNKDDGSPVTVADEAANDVILARLPSLLPGIPIVSEEGSARSVGGASQEDFIFVDPLDGTREYLAGRCEFTVNIGVVVDRVPMIGVIAAAAHRAIWRGAAGLGAQRLSFDPGAASNLGHCPIDIHTRRPADAVVAMVSRSHFDRETDAFLTARMVTRRLACGSSLKFCRIAEGRADLYARHAPTSQWDVAASHAILVAAGGAVTKPDGRPLSYGANARSFSIPGFVAWGDHAPL